MIRNMQTETETETECEINHDIAYNQLIVKTEPEIKPFTATFDNYEEAKQLIADYERKHVLQFALFKGVAKNFGQTGKLYIISDDNRMKT